MCSSQRVCVSRDLTFPVILFCGVHHVPTNVSFFFTGFELKKLRLYSAQSQKPVKFVQEHLALDTRRLLLLWRSDVAIFLTSAALSFAFEEFPDVVKLKVEVQLPLCSKLNYILPSCTFR